jgi:hypothetical protein
MKPVKEWRSRNVRAWNLKPGDVISFLDRKRMREMKRTVDAIEPEGDDQIIIRFRRWRPTLGLFMKRTAIMRVRRYETATRKAVAK